MIPIKKRLIPLYETIAVTLSLLESRLLATMSYFYRVEAVSAIYIQRQIMVDCLFVVFFMIHTYAACLKQYFSVILHMAIGEKKLI